MSDYKFKVTEDGYDIYLDDVKIITQHEPFIPIKNISYEENAKTQIAELINRPESKILINYETLVEYVNTNSEGLDDLGGIVSSLTSALDDLATAVSEMAENNL